MYRKILLFLILLLPVVMAPCIAGADTDSADYVVTKKIVDVNKGVAFDKPWKFHVGDSIQWSATGYDDSRWHSIATSFEEQEQAQLRQAGFKHIGWFRTSFYCDSAAAGKSLALGIKNSGAMSVYLNGELLETYGTFGEKGQQPVYENQNIPLLLPVRAAGKYELAIRFEKHDVYDEDAFFSINGFEVAIYPGELAIWKILTTIWVSAIALLPAGFVFLALFAVHFLLFLYYREDRSNLYFALFNLGAGAMLAVLFELTNTVSIRLQELLAPVCMLSALLAVFALSTFINHLFGRFGWRYRIMVGLCLITLVAFIFFRTNEVVSYTPLVLILLVALEAIVLIIIAIVKKRPGARILGVGILFFFGSIIFITLVAAITGGFGVDGKNTLGMIAMTVFIALFIFSIPLSISAYLAWKFSSTNKNLKAQVANVERLSGEKQALLENQKEALEKEVAVRTREVLQQKEQIEQEKKKSDDLLLNILPAEVAEELKENGATRARHFDRVSVLFTDFVNFTHIAEQLSPEELVQELHDCFRGFDEIIERNHMEKIKTIGDAYLAVSGMPADDERHAYHAVSAGLEILDFIQSRKQNKAAFEVRVGINSGSLVAGIVGVKKFAYDIWGDTVNMASRMESNSEAGRVNISESTHALVKDDFAFTHRGKVHAKNKGEVDMYFVARNK